MPPFESAAWRTGKPGQAYDAIMTETQTVPPAVNGQAPAPGPQAVDDCVDCATGGERALAVVAGLFGLFIIGLAVDMFTGGRLSKILAGAFGGQAPGDG